MIEALEDIQQEMRADSTLPYGKVYYRDSGGGSSWVKGVIRYAETPIIGGGDAIHITLVNTDRIVELPTGVVGRIEYREGPRSFDDA